jgi:Arc/MetJ family transcription regulator
MATAPVLRHKHVRIDQAKLQKAKRALKVKTDTEAIDQALALVASEGDIQKTLRRIGGKGRLKKAFR